MAFATQWWAKQSNPQRFDLYTRISLYFIFATEPLVVGYVLPDVQSRTYGILYASVIAVNTAFGIVVLRAGLAHFLQQVAPPRWLLVGLGGSALTAVVIALYGFEHYLSDGVGGGYWACLIPLLFSTAALAPLLSARHLAWLGAAATALLLVVGIVRGASAPEIMAAAIASTAAMFGAVLSSRASIAMLGLVWQMEHSRKVSAKLAVAEERLRFSRDVHDVLGRNLSVIAVKSSLAAQFAARGLPDAVTEMNSVREIAEESLREMREVVRGYRKADISVEIEGARGVLRAAGIACEVDNSAGDLPDVVHQALGWVVREATTNVLRHSKAGSCTITVSREAGPDRAVVRVDNDGTHATPDTPSGNGLIGLRERLEQVGGTLETAAGEGKFVLIATVPLESVMSA